MPSGCDHADLAAERGREPADDGLAADRPVEPVRQVRRGVVEALLLLALEHGLEAAADHAVDHEAGDQEDAEHDRAEDQPEPDAERHATGAAHASARGAALMPSSRAATSR